MKINIKNESNYERDSESNAILLKSNIDAEKYKNFKKQKQLDKLSIEQKINSLEQKLLELSKILTEKQ